MQKLKIDLKNNVDFLRISKLLKPYTNRAYLVGGCVRDALLGIGSDDFDIEIYDIKPDKFDILMQELGANGVGKSFFVYKYKNFDLALARYENKISKGHQGFDVRICHDEKDGARRRDFTINALMCNIFDFSFFDFFGGLNDLQNKIIRHIDEKSFIEDSLRVLRALYFSSRFDFSIDNSTLDLMKTMDITDLSRDRINMELYKIFSKSNLLKAYKGIQLLDLEEKIFFHRSKSKEFEKLLYTGQKYIHHEALFLYLYLNFFNFPIRKFFEKSKMKKELLKSCEQEFFSDKISDLELAKIALTRPLKEWLGLWDEERINQAKKMNLYDTKFQSKISAKDLLKEGFSGEKLGLELNKRKIKELKYYIEGINDE